MIRAILDYPGSLLGILEASNRSQVLLDFAKLVADEELEVVRFLTPAEFDDFRNNPPSGLRNARGIYQRMLEGIVRWDGGNCEATPILGPTDLTQTWKCGLRDAMPDAGNWRSPQIVVPSVRRNRWPVTDEIEILIDECEGNEASGGHFRVLATLEAYPVHPHARADVNPWDLRHAHPTQVGKNQNPCMLPRPPQLKGLDVNEISSKLDGIHSVNGNKRYYIPPAHWDAAAINREEWRRGRAFPRAKAKKNDRSGWLDRSGLVWHWDRDHFSGHWDVQLDDGDYVKVSHTGEVF